MELSYLHDFLAVARTKNFSEAADELYISQSTLSRHIHILEEELGVELFTRTTRKVYLSSYGELLLPYAENIIMNMNEFTAALKNERREEDSSIVVNTVIMTIWPYIHQFHEANPSYTIHLSHIDDTARIISMLEESKIDFAIGPSALNDENITSTVIYKERLSVVTSKESGLADKKSVSIADLADQNLFLPPENTVMFSQIISLFKKNNINPKIDITSASDRVFNDLISQNKGITFGSHNTPNSNDRIIAIPLNPPVIMNTYISYSEQYVMSEPKKKFLSFMKKIGALENL